MDSPSFSAAMMGVIFVFSFMAFAPASAQMAKCPNEYVFHLGDGVTDVGNSILIRPWGPKLPAAKLPYGVTYPGYPTGRWSDGLIDFDYAAADTSFPILTPYLSGNTTSDSKAVIFSVARSPVLDHEFYQKRCISIPPHAVPFKEQARWFKQYLNEVTRTPKERSERLRKSIVFFGDIEGNDVGYSLVAGKSFDEIRTYVPHIIEAQLSVARELILMGAKTFVIPGNSHIGCYPYILTALQSKNPDDYDKFGCLKKVNDFIDWKNSQLNESIQALHAEFPDTLLLYSPFSAGFRAYLQQYVAPNGPVRLRSCCGGGGPYNFNQSSECGHSKATVCKDPKQHLFWDGQHFTQEAYNLIEKIMVAPSFQIFNCTILKRAAVGIIRPVVAVA